MFFMGKKLHSRKVDIKLTPLEYMILLKTYEKDPVGISGYDLINGLTNTFAAIWSAKSGTIYPLLSRMQKKDLIIAKEEKSELGPAKKVLKITDRSKLIIEEMILSNFRPELSFFSNYLEFICNILIQLKEKHKITEAQLIRSKKGLELFSANLNRIQEKLEFALDEVFISCSNCDAKIVGNAKFCPNCGMEIEGLKL